MLKKRPPRAPAAAPTKRPAPTKRASRARATAPATRGKPRAVTTIGRNELAVLRKRLSRADARAARWNPDSDDVQRSVARLVLALIELIRRLLERQVLRRMKRRTLSAKEIESLGVALMELEQTVRDMAGRFNIPPEEINLDLGPLGKLL